MHRYSTDIIGEKKRALANGKHDGYLEDRKDVMSLLRALNMSFSHNAFMYLPAFAITDGGVLTVAANMEASADDRLPDEDFVGLVTCVFILQLNVAPASKF